MQRPVQKLTALLSIPCQYFLPIVHQHIFILRDSERGVGGGGVGCAVCAKVKPKNTTQRFWPALELWQIDPEMNNKFSRFTLLLPSYKKLKI